MGINKLVIGQEIKMFSGCYGMKGTVIKVSPSGVEVQDFGSNDIYRFDSLGHGCDGHGTREGGPWELDLP
jgi:hypothetical protein